MHSPCEVASFGAIYNKDEPPRPGRHPAGGDCWWSTFLLCTGSKVNTSILWSATAWQAAKGLTVQSHTAAVCCLPRPTQCWLPLVTEASVGVEGPWQTLMCDPRILLGAPGEASVFALPCGPLWWTIFHLGKKKKKEKKKSNNCIMFTYIMLICCFYSLITRKMKLY